MKRLVHSLHHEQRSLIAQLALRSAFTPEDLQTLLLIFDQCSPARILEALDQVLAELAHEHQLPVRPSRAVAHSLDILYTGVCRLAEQEHATYHRLAA